ncbi:unnamed protein product [Durusdinium trenchii]|uniref:Uncharacterized protein n=1 Tax=Durusdinium trenchii TaxID=1381693 RepID=A0ABP0JNX8_9DINO
MSKLIRRIWQTCWLLLQCRRTFSLVAGDATLLQVKMTDSMADGWSPIEYQLWNASNAGESTSLQVVMRSSDASGWSGNSYTLTSGGSQLSSDTLLSGMYDGSVSVAVNVGQELIFSLPNPGGTTSTISWDLQTTNADGTFTIYSVSSTDPDLIKFPTALTFTMPGLSFRRVRHKDLGLREDCVSLVSCRPDRKRGWRATEGQWPECEKSPGETLSAAVRDFLCSTLPSENSWYDFEGYERARLRYRFGTADRAHCAVPAWRYLREEPLRLYSLLQAKLEATKILINIGAGDASIDDPLGNILRNFAGGKTWSGVYFDAVPENCEKVRQAMDETNSEIRVHCGFSTPDSVVSAICRSLQGVPGMKETCQSAGVTRVAAVDARAARIDVDALSIDIDSFDCAVLREVLRVVSPKMVSVEVMPLPPPVSVLTEFHPQHLRSANANMSGYAAISGGTTRQGGFFPGCSLSAAIALLWPNSLGLYRLSARDALFVRKDVAELVLGEDWRPADEFQCWRHLCADLGLTANLMNLTSLGVYRRLMPFVHDMLKERFFQVQQSHPFTLAVAMPPPSQELPSVKLWKKSCLLIGSATLPSSVSGQVDLLPAYVGDDLLFSVLTGGSTDTMYIGWSLMEMDSSQIYSAQDAASDAVKFPFLINFTVAGPSACVQNTAREVSFYMDVYSTDMDFSMATFTKIFADESWLYLLPTASKLFRVDLMTISQVESLDVGGSSFTGGFTDGTYGYLVPSCLANEEFTG